MFQNPVAVWISFRSPALRTKVAYNFPGLKLSRGLKLASKWSKLSKGDTESVL